MAAKNYEWTPLENSVFQDHYNLQYSYAVHHSFGRGSFRQMAEKAIVPKLVLDKIIGSKKWSDTPPCPRGHGAAKLGGGAASISVGIMVKPKNSGRGRALQMRARKASSFTQKRPGGNKVSNLSGNC